MKRPDETTVLIPAAGRVPEGLLALANISTPAMIPVAGRPVIHWTIKYLSSLGLRRFVVAVPRRGLFIEDFLAGAFGRECDISYIVPQPDRGVGGTILELAETVTSVSALVVLGDTHFQLEDPALLDRSSPWVLVHPVDDSYRWCVAETGDDGVIRALHDKDPDLRGEQQALVGVYSFPDAQSLKAAARNAVAEADSFEKRTEMSAILRRIARDTPIHAVTAKEWLDCGNPDRQAAAHRTLLQARAFNEVAIDPVLGTLTKRSRKVEKFIDEINYLRLLPPELAVLFPRVLSYSTEWDEPWVRMEYYGYPTLSEVFVFESVNPGIWEQVFHHLREVMTTGFMHWRRPLSKDAVYSMCIEKTRERLATLDRTSELGRLAHHPGELRVNGRAVANLPSLWTKLEHEVRLLDDNAKGSIIHGDLCLSNVLYDLRSRIIKLIDPRGSFGGAGIYGDIRYDVAKLYHSVYGCYDLIVNDLFDVEVEGTDIRLEIRTQRRHQEICERFESVFFPTFDRREIKLFTALLFVSMPALHYDAPRRQVAMYVRGLELFAEVFETSSTLSDRSAA